MEPDYSWVLYTVWLTHKILIELDTYPEISPATVIIKQAYAFKQSQT